RPVSPYSCCCAAPPTTAPYTLSLHDALPISPFAFAGHHHVHVEGGEQAEAFGAGVVVHARERLVQCDQARRVRVARRLVVRGRGGEQGHRRGEDAFAAGRRARRGAPLAVLEALDRERVPGAVVQRAGELLDPPGRGVVGVLAGDLLLEEPADGGAVVHRPGVDGLAQLLPDAVQPFGGVLRGLPDEPQLHTRGGGAGGQLGVHLLHLVLGGGDELDRKSTRLNSS